jgi:hypothetical protein
VVILWEITAGVETPSFPMPDLALPAYLLSQCVASVNAEKDTIARLKCMNGVRILNTLNHRSFGVYPTGTLEYVFLLTSSPVAFLLVAKKQYGRLSLYAGDTFLGIAASTGNA